MTTIPYILLGLFIIIILFLLAKIHLLRKSAKEIREAFAQKLTEDTNTLIDISSRDACMRDLAEEINAQLRLLRRERRRCQQGDLELTEAVTNISHDLRTPLTTICGYLDLLEREETSETVRRYLKNIQNRTDALRSLTEELFRYSIASSCRDLKPEPVDLVRALEENLLLFHEIMEEKGIRPQVSLPEEPVWRTLDAGALNRIFSNITGNALKYSDRDFSVHMKKDGSITFANTAKDLTPVSVEKLFDRFYTVEESRSSTGLGLSIARQLTQRMGGRIRAGYREQTLSVTIEFP